ncbi:hypothetical protein U91I_03612 [alpha proteobacterium U9-1i]|nr:hypothetical protein U91I_03612 [alpha proteobacterium U9-1i]
MKPKRYAKNNPTDPARAYTRALNMKRPIAPPITHHRLARLSVWAGLWLVWAGAFLAGLRCGFRKSRTLDAPRHHIAQMTRFVIVLLMMRATPLVKHIQRRPRAYGPNAYRTGGRWRADVGVALRKQFRAPTLLGRIAKLSDALRHPEKYLRAIAQRITRNLTKRTRLYALTFVVAAMSAQHTLTPLLLDST